MDIFLLHHVRNALTQNKKKRKKEKKYCGRIQVYIQGIFGAGSPGNRKCCWKLSLMMQLSIDLEKEVWRDKGFCFKEFSICFLYDFFTIKITVHLSAIWYFCKWF